MTNNNNKKIGIIAANNIRFSPYILLYTNIFEENNIPFELIYPNRNGINESWNGISHMITWNKNLPSPISYAVYLNKVKGIIKSRKYNKLIILTTVNAVLLSLWLKKHYSNQYIIDIRDYTYENVFSFAQLEKIAIENARYRIISSEKFKLFLPPNKYYIAHNMNYSNISEKYLWYRHQEAITIGYVGTTGYIDNVRKMINLVEKDPRFNFYIFGGGLWEDTIRKLVNEASCLRIKYFGPYRPEEKEQIVQNIDIFFNAYGNNSPMLLFALSNKLYDSMFFHKLIINSPGTYMEEMSGITGYSIDLDNANNLDCLYNWYKNLDEVNINSYQNLKLKEFLEENNKTKEIIIKFSKE